MKMMSSGLMGGMGLNATQTCGTIFIWMIGVVLLGHQRQLDDLFGVFVDNLILLASEVLRSVLVKQEVDEVFHLGC
jgi:hypothetical protein